MHLTLIENYSFVLSYASNLVIACYLLPFSVIPLLFISYITRLY